MRVKRECIRGGTRQSCQLTVVVSDGLRGIAEGNSRPCRLIIKDIRHRDNSPRQIAGLWEMEESYLCPNNFGLRMTLSRKRMTKQFSGIIVADEEDAKGAVSG